jgi:16S rRNA (uracil1498-N3)-methyltransferase
MARRRFFVDAFAEGFAVLRGDDAKHLARVLRAEPGQQYELSDNHTARLAEIVQASPSEVRFRLLQPVESAPLPLRVTLVASLIKFDRFEWLVEKATELGAAAILPVSAARSESGLLEAAHKRVERWRKIARESSRQSRRLTLPEILAPERLDRISISALPLRLFLDEEPGAPSLHQSLRGIAAAPAVAGILIGPEGGWTPTERQHLAEIWTPVSLGRQILRAETAAVAALAIVMNFWT